MDANAIATRSRKWDGAHRIVHDRRIGCTHDGALDHVRDLTGDVGSNDRHLQPHGFTLVEVLVVLVILAIAAGVAVVSFDGDERGTAVREARRFAGALEHAAQRAQVRAETLGVSADGRTWRFWRRHAETNQWQPLDDDDVLAAHPVPASMNVSALAYAGQPIIGQPILPLRATGRNEPFAFAIDAEHTRVMLASDPLNRVVLSTSTSDEAANRAVPAR